MGLTLETHGILLGGKKSHTWMASLKNMYLKVLTFFEEGLQNSLTKSLFLITFRHFFKLNLRYFC